jgi:hypothetical protein
VVTPPGDGPLRNLGKQSVIEVDVDGADDRVAPTVLEEGVSAVAHRRP